PYPLEKDLTQSYIDYAMSVIISRALPDTRDGCKPVIRRILYGMYDMKMFYNTKHKKSARIVGDVMGKYHPHGDSSIYEAMVRLAQPWSMRYPLVDGQGNFGSMDGDGAAAMRYTEARLTKIAEEMINDIEQDTVDRRNNFDGSLQEPVMLPTKFPNHLCNGTMGIAVGMATNLAPHNLNEVIDACLLLIQKEGKEVEVPIDFIDNNENLSQDEGDLQSSDENITENTQNEELPNIDSTTSPDSTNSNGTKTIKYSVSIDEIMEIVKGPDFPTGGYIFDPNRIKEVYSKGRGGIVCRGRHEIEEIKSGKNIVITEIPYMVNKSTLVSKIGELVVDKKIDGIVDIRDESNKNKIRVVLQLRKGINPDQILIQLYKATDLQSNFNVNNVSLVDNGLQPRTLNIKELLMEFVTFRRQVVYRRSNYQLDKARDRLHILEGLKKAIDIIDEVIETIKKSATKQEAKENLMAKFDFSDQQAEYILLMRLQSLVGLEIQKISDEIDEKIKLIEYLESIINNSEKLDEVVVEELNYIKEKYGDERKTEVSNDLGVYSLGSSLKAYRDAADKIKEDVILRIGNDYHVRVLYQSRILAIPEETLELIYTHNQDNLIVITDLGELVVERLKDLGQFTMVKNALDLKEQYGLKGNIIFAKTLHYHYEHLLFLTKDNNIKKINKDLILKFKKFPTIVMKLEAKEKIAAVLAVSDGDNVAIVTEQGRGLLFPASDIRAMGKTAGGVKAIDLQEGDRVSNMFLHKEQPFLLVHNKKEAKLLSLEDLRVRKRARKGDVWATGDCKLEGGISIEEGAIRIRFTDGSLKTLHSNDVKLDMPDTPLKEIVKKDIELIYRPWEEKEENFKGKEERKAREKAEREAEEKRNALFSDGDIE
ncbi:MAG TPA: DNA gyrase subunit A, partial [Candidatus Absconditabacterales bacterium]|nr:DNA gyrase subunit A [Candidatus Absconditabacterales bacterium]